jgi:hypothetical protein
MRKEKREALSPDLRLIRIQTPRPHPGYLAVSILPKLNASPLLRSDRCVLDRLLIATSAEYTAYVHTISTTNGIKSDRRTEQIGVCNHRNSSAQLVQSRLQKLSRTDSRGSLYSERANIRMAYDMRWCNVISKRKVNHEYSKRLKLHSRNILNIKVSNTADT